MYWETKVQELQRFAAISIRTTGVGRWHVFWETSIKRDFAPATEDFPSGEGVTVAAAIDDLWRKLATGGGFTVNADSDNPTRLVWNGVFHRQPLMNGNYRDPLELALAANG